MDESGVVNGYRGNSWVYENKLGVAEDLQYLSHMPELCDVTFLVGDNKEPVCAVRAILAARSRLVDIAIFHKLRLNLEVRSGVNFFFVPKIRFSWGGGGGVSAKAYVRAHIYTTSAKSTIGLVFNIRTCRKALGIRCALMLSEPYFKAF